MEERHRIGEDLHDDVAQILFAAQMQLDAALEIEDLTIQATDKLSLARSLLIRADVSIRDMIVHLGTVNANGLPERLAEVVSDVEQEFAIAVHLEISGDAIETAKRARRPVADLVLRVARESLVNAAKHARPSRVSVTLDTTRPDRLRLRVLDDGIGLHERHDAPHHGLASLRRAARKRGGSFEVQRGSAGGTLVGVSIPI
jgi:signal transduction histidine kinase